MSSQRTDLPSSSSVSLSNPPPCIYPSLDVFMCFTLSCNSATSVFISFPFPFEVGACFPSQIPTNSILFPTTSTILSCAFRQWHWRSERISVLPPADVSYWLSALLYPQLEGTVFIPNVRSCTISHFPFLILKNPALFCWKSKIQFWWFHIIAEC